MPAKRLTDARLRKRTFKQRARFGAHFGRERFMIQEPNRHGKDYMSRRHRSALAPVRTREEFTRGFSSIAAPVLVSGHPVAAISVAGPTGRILGLRRDFIVASVCRAAQRVSTLIGDCLWSAAANAS